MIRPRAMLVALRPHQWLKNLLVFVPMIAAHAVSTDTLRLSLLAFAAFSLCASAGYVINDLMDRESDRQHLSKRNRPFASGTLSVAQGYAMIVLLLIAVIGLGLTVSPAFLGVLALYFAGTLAYSLYLKRKMLVDVMALGGFYTLRIAAGGVATQLPITAWLLMFSLFMFLCLAIVKRYTELIPFARGQEGAPKGRGYEPAGVTMLAPLGGAAGYVSVMILGLYISNPDVHDLYASPEVLWLACPLLAYWVSRLLLFAHRGAMHDDPIIFAVKDWVSLTTAFLLAIIVAVASIGLPG